MIVVRARVVHQNVDLPECRDNLGPQSGALGWHREVRGENRMTIAGETLHCRVGRTAIGVEMHGDAATANRKVARNREPDSTGGAGDKGGGAAHRFHSDSAADAARASEAISLRMATPKIFG